MTWWRDRWAWATAVLGVVLRLVWVAVAVRPPKILADPALYYYSALQIACGRGYVALAGAPCTPGEFPDRTAYYPPGYPYFLGAVQWVLRVTGQAAHTLGTVGVLQALLGGVTVLAVHVVGRRLGGRSVGLAAGLVVAVWPNLVVYSGLLLSETLFVAAAAVSLAAVLTVGDDDRWHWGRAVVAGGSFGVAAMVRPQVLLVVPALVAAWALARTGWRATAARAAVLVAGVVVLAAPWTVRNLALFDAVVPFSTNGGDNLCVGFNPEATGGFGIPEACDTGEFYTDGPAAERRRDVETRRRAVEWATGHLGELPRLSLAKMGLTYRTDTDGLYAAESFGRDPFLGAARRPLQLLVEVAWGVVLAAAVAGLGLTAVRGWRDRRADPTGLCVVAATLAGALVPVLFFGDPRFKLAVAPCLAVLAAVTLTLPWRGRRASVGGGVGDSPADGRTDGPAPRTDGPAALAGGVGDADAG